jgi:hypothetical protein
VRDEGVWGLLEERALKDNREDIDSRIERQERFLRLSNYLPSFANLSLILCLIIAATYFAGPLFGLNRRSWDSGPISNSHKMIESDCEQCHVTPFRPVQDEQCLACHSLSEHAEEHKQVLKKHPELSLRCAQCHMEHNGDGALIASESNLCTSCHGNLEQFLPSSESSNITSLANHPEFRVLTIGDADADRNAGVWGVKMDNQEKATETARVKFNHKIHLEPDLEGADGPVTLSCMDCHRLTDKLREVDSISFERDCSSCHPLEFDSRLPGRAVPHGDPDVIYNYLYAEYAKLFLDIEGREPTDDRDPRRRKPSRKVQRGEILEFSRNSVDGESRSVEESLFTRTACYLCHVITEKSGETEDILSPKLSKYAVVPPHIPDTYMPDALFDHGAHQEISCESCHAGVRKSEETMDLHLPGVDNCRQCHSQGEESDKVASDCISCHSFHDPLIMDEPRKREIEKILLSSREQKKGEDCCSAGE